MIKGETILIIAESRWDLQRPDRRLAVQLERENTVIFVESGGHYKDISRRVGRLDYIKRFQSHKPNWITDRLVIFRLSPMLPLYVSIASRLFRKTIKSMSIRLSKRIQARLLRRQLRELGLFPTILFFYDPFDLFMIGQFSERVACEVVHDEWKLLPHKANVADILWKIESDNLHRSDVVIATSSAQYERRKSLHSNVHFVPNAVNFELFNAGVIKELPKPPDLKHIPLPRIGYVGSLCYRIDYTLLKKLASEHPEWSLVMIGNRSSYGGDEIVSIGKLHNVYQLPMKDYESIPRYLAHFDVGLMPFLVNKLTNTMNFLKMYEYLAAGLPVVSTGVREVRTLGDVIRIAKDYNEFIEAIEDELRTNSEEKIQRRVEIARKNTWEQRAMQISELINCQLNSKKH